MNINVGKTFFCLFTVFCFFNLSSQTFSGKITYEFTYVSKDKKVKQRELVIDMPTDSVVYTIMNGHYKSERYYKGELIEFYTYSAEFKKMFYTTNDREYFIYYLPHDQKYKTTLYTEHHSGKESILSFSTYKSTSVIGGQENLNFYSPEISIDPASFEGHFFSAWDELLKHNDGAIPLRTITNNYDHYEIKSATRVEHLNLQNSDFKPKKNVEIVASSESIEIPPLIDKHKQADYFCYMAKVEEIASKMIEGKKYNYMLRMVIDENGKASHIKAINNDYLGFEKVAKEIINECNISFIPGKIGDRNHKAEIVIPFEL